MTSFDDRPLRCTRCGLEQAVTLGLWRCDACGGAFGLDPLIAAPSRASDGAWSMWRYTSWLPAGVDDLVARISLGEGATPLVPLDLPGSRTLAKLDFVMPTGSFKDRGAVVLATLGAALGATRAVVDSSGNAAASAAAYFARAGIACDVFVPASTSAGKLGAARLHGATVHAVDGTREDVAAAAIELVDDAGAFYASHVWNPWFHEGTKTFGFEIWEQLGGNPPDVVVLPLGNGTLVLGVIRAFEELRYAGAIDRPPAVVAVQSAHVDPIVRRWRGETGPTEHRPTVAEGIAIAAPPRATEIVDLLAQVGGACTLAVESDVLPERERLARVGCFVEPTAAATVAAARSWVARRQRGELAEWETPTRALADEPSIVVPLCGTGLKTTA